MRRVNINGNLTLMDYCTDGPQWASGGFIADSKTGSVTNGSQQQYLVRDSSIGSWSNGVWNQVFAGVQGAPATNFGVPTPIPTDGRASAPTPTCRPIRPAGRSPTSTSIPPGSYNVFVPDAADQFVGHHLGERPHARPVDSAVAASSWPSRPIPSPPSTRSCAGQEPAAHPRGVRRRPEHPDQPRRHRRARAWASPP